ncbi:hypothetical protein B0H16DRAFT_1729641 [Mycena metata]|uniref:Uncharacterized protein n=1 Tax=Mycena metata TaxID=1033252 RepID=A0AAD7MZF4_9AGAR|nr:hypothetical protein B0H16DRAFT_1729641 [Mycena metata]
MSATITTLPSVTALPDDQSKPKAGDGLVSNLNSPEAKKQAYETARSVGPAIRDIRKGLISVADALITFDSKNFKNQEGNTLSLGKEWKPLIQEFETTLQFSLAQAIDTTVVMKTITAVLGDVAGIDAKDLADELAQFLEQLRSKEASALESEQRITLVNQGLNDILTREDLVTVGTWLDESKKIVASVSSQILIIANFWKMIHLDMLYLRAALSSQVEGTPVITKYFFKKLDVVKEICHHITLLLDTYVEQTNIAN